ncbi:MAG: hypothetical protein M3419_11350 [Actinomycetota bacterium]|nr:hypothetical protein [Actinomycetota bacterium]
MAAKTVYVHLGLPKTGTTYIQSALWESRDRLASAGCLVPGDKRVSTWLAACDFMGRRPQGADAPAVAGSWSGFVEAIGRWDGDRVILSQELLGNATRRQAQRMAKSLRPCDVHVVLTVRDLGRTLPSLWQQEIRKGRTWTWGEFVAAVRDPESGPATAGVAFWLRFDVQRVLQTWDGVIPPSNIHVVIVPPPGAPADALLGRFAEATGVDRLALTCQQPGGANAAVGMAEAEVLRRLNVGLAGKLNERQYARAVVQPIVPVLQERTSSSRGRLPVEHRSWVAEQSEALVDFLQRQPYHVVGDLTDLAPRSDADSGPDPDGLDEAQLAEPMMQALVAVCATYGKFWWQARRREDMSSADASTRFASRARVLGYQARRSVLERADSNALFGRLARAYLRRSASGASAGFRNKGTNAAASGRTSRED